MKIGRNDPCPCGSGRKFKKCHNNPRFELPFLIQQAHIEKHLEEEGKRLLEQKRAKEIQRQHQQGLGRPIISIEFQGYRFVAVGSKVHYGKWKTFHDFLGNYIRNSLGGEWGNTELKKPVPERHPILKWYCHVCKLQQENAKKLGPVFSSPMTGAASAYYRLAYNLYLIAHNGKDIQTRLLARLRNADNFPGAFFETQVAAWLIKAGFELEFEDESDKSRSGRRERRRSRGAAGTNTGSPSASTVSTQPRSASASPGRRRDAGVSGIPCRRSRMPRTTNSISVAARIANGSQNGIAACRRAESSQRTTKASPPTRAAVCARSRERLSTLAG